MTRRSWPTSRDRRTGTAERTATAARTATPATETATERRTRPAATPRASWRRADVAIEGGRIAAIGRLGGADAARVIHASDRYVTPGFIDIHTHSDAGLLADPTCECAIRQGATTHVIGNGVVAVEDRAFLGRRDGRVLRGVGTHHG